MHVIKDMCIKTQPLVTIYFMDYFLVSYENQTTVGYQVIIVFYVDFLLTCDYCDYQWI